MQPGTCYYRDLAGLAGESGFTRCSQRSVGEHTADSAKHDVLLEGGAGSFTNKVLVKHEFSISEFEFQFNSLSGFPRYVECMQSKFALEPGEQFCEGADMEAEICEETDMRETSVESS